MSGSKQGLGTALKLWHQFPDNVLTAGLTLIGLSLIGVAYWKQSDKEYKAYAFRTRNSYTVVRDTDVEDPKARHLN